MEQMRQVDRPRPRPTFSASWWKRPLLPSLTLSLLSWRSRLPSGQAGMPWAGHAPGPLAPLKQTDDKAARGLGRKQQSPALEVGCVSGSLCVGAQSPGCSLFIGLLSKAGRGSAIPGVLGRALGPPASPSAALTARRGTSSRNPDCRLQRSLGWRPSRSPGTPGPAWRRRAGSRGGRGLWGPGGQLRQRGGRQPRTGHVPAGSCWPPGSAWAEPSPSNLLFLPFI